MSASQLLLPVLKQQRYVFVQKEMPTRMCSIFMPTGSHVRYFQGDEAAETDSHTVIVQEPLQVKGVFFGQHINSAEGVWSAFTQKRQLYYPEYTEGQLVQCYCHDKNFWGDYIVAHKNEFVVKMQKNKSSMAQYAPSYQVFAIVGDDLEPDKKITRQVAAYDMRGQEWRSKQMTELGLDATKAHVVPDPDFQPAEKKNRLKKKTG